LDGASNSIVSVVTPYKMDIVQGNFVSKEQAEAVRPGMSRAQVRDSSGHAFADQRVPCRSLGLCVYVQAPRPDAAGAQSHPAFFRGDLLEQIEADVLPTEAEFVASLDSGRKSVKVPVLEMSPESLQKLPVVAPSAAPKPLPPLPAAYPPLESDGR